MVQIDAVVFSTEDTKRLIRSNSCNGNNPTREQDFVASEKRFKVVSPYPRNCCDNCMFFTFNFLMKHPVIGLIICIVFLMSLAFIGPTFCYMKGLLQTTIENEISQNINQCSDGKSTGSVFMKEEHKEKPFHSKQCEDIRSEDRFYCLPQDFPDEEECISRGCCWLSRINESVGLSLSAPQCFYPSNFKSYQFINITATDEGAVAFLKMVRNSSYPNNVPVLKMNFNYWTENMLEVKVSKNVFSC